MDEVKDRKQLIDRMVNRFLQWRLPENFVPDCGISFNKPSKPYTEKAWWPVGTNLLDATQAKEMIEWILQDEKEE